MAFRCKKTIKIKNASLIQRLLSPFLKKKTCSLDFLCKKCRFQKIELCKSYHLVNSLKYSNAVKKYVTWFQWLIDDIIYYSAFDVELDLRNYYEQIYICNPDSGHLFWKQNLANNSILENDVALSKIFYWKKISFLVALNTINHVETVDIIKKFDLLVSNRHQQNIENAESTEKKYNLFSCVKQPTESLVDSFYFSFFLNFIDRNSYDTKFKNRKSILNILDLEYDKKRIMYVHYNIEIGIKTKRLFYYFLDINDTIFKREDKSTYRNWLNIEIKDKKRFDHINSLDLAWGFV